MVERFTISIKKTVFSVMIISVSTIIPNTYACDLVNEEDGFMGIHGECPNSGKRVACSDLSKIGESESSEEDWMCFFLPLEKKEDASISGKTKREAVSKLCGC